MGGKITPETRQRWKNKRIELGFCATCWGNQRIPGLTQCSACKDKRIERRKNRIAMGLCQCGRKARKNKTWCRACIKRYRNWAKTSRARARDIVNRKKTRDRIRTEVLLHYGGKCSCCGERNTGFLTIDHKDPAEGKLHRVKYRNATWYKVIQDMGFPDSLQCLCYNCNLGRSKYKDKICPHLKPPITLVQA
jgi:hypothetical protein